MKFFVGLQVSNGGIDYRVIQGHRCPGDMVIQFATRGWAQPKVAHTLIMAEFKAQVEENNYGKNGRVQKGQGAEYLIAAIRRAIKWGWEDEAAHIASEASAAKLKRDKQYALDLECANVGANATSQPNFPPAYSGEQQEDGYPPWIG